MSATRPRYGLLPVVDICTQLSAQELIFFTIPAPHCPVLQIPSSVLSAEELSEYLEEGEEAPDYISAEFDDMRTYYKAGDKIDAFVLDYTDQGELNLTQYTDAEVEADGFDIIDDDEGEVRSTEKHRGSVGGEGRTIFLSVIIAHCTVMIHIRQHQ